MKMLAYIRGRATDRKMRLFISASCRRIWPLLVSARSRLAVEVAEWYVDAMASKDRLVDAWRDAESYFLSTSSFGTSTGDGLARAAATAAEPGAIPYFHHRCFRYNQEELPAQADLLRDLFGNPFRPVKGDPALFAWNDGVIPKLARAAYDARHLPEGALDETRMAILADALEEAGCIHEKMLHHCRSRGPHVRGCWLIDLLLSKA
jgi:hypothetical protein